VVSIAQEQFAESMADTEIATAGSSEKRELRVLQVFSVLGMGGAERWLISLLKYFREAEEEVPVRVKFDILLTGGERAVFDEEAVALGAKLFSLRLKR
jgi:hypothetical protein